MTLKAEESSTETVNPAVFACSEGAKNPYFICGLSHFLRKYGLSKAVSTDSMDIYFGYSLPCEYKPKIRVVFRNSSSRGLCYLNIGGEELPFFCTPCRIEHGESLMQALCGGKAYNCAACSENTVIIGFDLLAECGKFLCGFYDDYFLRKDEPGKKLRSLPVVDILEEWLFQVICRSLPEMNLRPLFNWPDGHRFAMVLTHDVDEVSKRHQYLPSIAGAFRRGCVSELFYHLSNLLFRHGLNNPYWTFDAIIKLENALGVKSTFYFLHETGKVNPFKFRSWILYSGRYRITRLEIQEVIKKLKAAGFEIGVHGSYRSYCDTNLLMNEKRILEWVTGDKVLGVRQHYLNYNPVDTPRIHLECGFAYDSSIGLKPASGIGFRRGTCFPFLVTDVKGTSCQVLELPLIIMDSAVGISAQPEECFRLMDQVEKYRGVLTILWHTRNFCEKENRLLANLYEKLIIEAQARNAWIARAVDVCNWVLGWHG